MQPCSPAHSTLPACTKANRRNIPSSGGFCSLLSSGKSPLAKNFGKQSSVLCFSCSGATLLNCCILSTTSSATRIFDPASGGTFEVGEGQVPGCVAGQKDNVVWEQPRRVFTIGRKSTRALPVSFEDKAKLPRELLGSFPQQQPKPGCFATTTLKGRSEQFVLLLHEFILDNHSNNIRLRCYSGVQILLNPF